MTFQLKDSLPDNCGLILAKLSDVLDFPLIDGVETWQKSIRENIKYFQDREQKITIALKDREWEHSSLATGSEGVLPLHLSSINLSAKAHELGNQSSALLQWGKNLAAVIIRNKWKHIALPCISGLNLEQFRLVLEGIWFASYQFSELKKNKELNEPILTVIANGENQSKLQSILEDISWQIDAVKQTLKLVLSPANICTPEFFCEFVHQQTNPLSRVKTEIWGEAELEKKGLNLLLAVGRGSPEESRLLILEYQGDDANSEHIALVGKGVCFDTGGTNLKASANIKGMQYDMMGAAIVYGAFYYLARTGIKGNIRAYIPLVENQIGCAAIKTGDIIRSAMGLTVEINNTDAEGRLILADAIHCAVQHQPTLILDCATLTGAAIVALGEQCAAYYSNDERISHLFTQASQETGEEVWQLPLFRPYASFLDSKLADISNISTAGSSGGGSLTAALFLERFALQNAKQTEFVEKNQNHKEPHSWLHLDLAGWSSLNEHPALGKNARAMGVRLLSNFVRRYFQDQG